MSGRVPLLTGGYSEKGGVRKDTPKSMRNAWRMILGYVYEARGLFFLAMFMVFLESALTAIAPEFVGNITDLISDGLYTGSIDLDSVSVNGLIALLLYLSGSLAMYARQYWMAGIAQTVAKNMRSDLERKMERLPLRFYDNCRKGDVMSRFTNDADTVGSALARSLPVFAHGIILFFVCLFMMLVTDLKLAFVSIIAASGGMIVSALIVKYTQKYYRNHQYQYNI